MGVLDGKSALVTGGAGGFGLGSALLFARDGAAVTLMGRTASSLEAAAARIGETYPRAKVATCTGDACRDEDVQAAVSLAAERHGGLHMVVATVGGSLGGGMIAQASGDAFMNIVSYNLRSAYIAIRYAVPAMTQGGAFVLVSSSTAVTPVDGLAAYSAGKAAVDQLVRAAANELGPQGFRFNSVRPGFTRTGATDPLLAIPGLVDNIVARTPLGRIGEADEVCNLIRHLAGPESSWTTGQSIAVDGGQEIRGAAPVNMAR